jgi:hypothetical protein
MGPILTYYQATNIREADKNIVSYCFDRWIPQLMHSMRRLELLGIRGVSATDLNANEFGCIVEFEPTDTAVY